MDFGYGNDIAVVICSHFSIFETLETTEKVADKQMTSCDLLSF